MSVEQSGAAAPGLVDRAKAILLTPKTEWEKIAVEPADTGKLITGYLLPLAVIAALSFAIGASVFGIGGFGFSVKLGMTTVIAMAVTQVVMAVIGALVFAWVINALAPSFGSTPNMLQAQKLVVYSYTASFLAAVFQIYPPLSALSILGLYSLVLLYMGLTPMMKTPQDKRVGYFVVAIICAIVVFIVIGVVTSAVRGAIGGPMGLGGSPFSMNAPDGGKVEGKVTVPGGGTIDLSEMQKYARQMEEAQKNGTAGAAALVAPAQLQALLPDALPGGFARTAVSSESAGAAGMGASTAKATYARGGAEIELTVVHMGGMAAMASMAGAMGVTANREDSNGYEKANSVDGRLVTEAVDKSANTAKFAIVGKNGAAVTAEGSGGVTVDEAKAAVAAVNVERVEALGAAAK
jgi:Yip1 domain